MIVKISLSLDGNDWQIMPYAMAEKIGKEIKTCIDDSILLCENNTEFVAGQGSLHDFSGNIIGEVLIEEDKDA